MSKRIDPVTIQLFLGFSAFGMLVLLPLMISELGWFWLIVLFFGFCYFKGRKKTGNVGIENLIDGINWPPSWSHCPLMEEIKPPLTSLPRNSFPRYSDELDTHSRCGGIAGMQLRYKPTATKLTSPSSPC